MTFVLIHGSWHNGVAWYKVQKLLEEKGYPVLSPTLSGFEGSAKPARPDVGLNTHIEDILSLVERENLTNTILVGHSYAGLVISGVAELIPDRVSKLVYLDAFIPEDKQSLFDILGSAVMAKMRGDLVNAEGKTKAEGATQVWLLPPGQPQDYGVTEPAEVEWLQERMVYTPVLTFEEKVRLGNPQAQSISRYFIRCTDFAFLEPYEQKATSLGWPVFRIKTGHDAMLTKPEELAAILQEIQAN
jgi:pimeloyl-ACP methyl ester carboxylesterase